MPATLRRLGWIAVLLFGGMAVGVLLAWLLAPDSGLARFVGLLILPLSLGAGIALWYAVAFATVWRLLSAALMQSARGGDLESDLKARLQHLRGRPIPGTHVFVPACLLISLAGGGLVGLAPSARGFWLALVVFAAAGLGYGLLLRHLARAGRLPVPGEG